MTFSSSLFDHRIQTNLSNIYVKDDQKTQLLFSSHNPIPEVQVSQTGPLTHFDKFWQALVSVGLDVNKGIISEEAIKKYPLESFNDDEFKSWFNLVSRTIVTTFKIKFSMLEFYAFLLTVGPRVGITIKSTNMVGGKNPQLFSDYYIRTWNNIYKSRCNVLEIVPQGDLISKEIAEDLLRASPDYDFATGIEGDLEVANDLTTKFFAWKLSKINIDHKYDLAEAIREVLKFENVAIVQTSQYRFSIEKIPIDCEVKIRKSFFNKYFNNTNTKIYDKSDSEFALASFGNSRFVIDHTFLPHKMIGQTLFDHHSLIVPCLNQVEKFIDALRLTNLSPNTILEMNRLPNITPFHAFGRGLEAIGARLGKRLRLENNANDRAWSGYISNITIGYDGWEQNELATLFSKVRVEDRLPFLKSKWENHHLRDNIKDLQALIALGFNAMISLPENAEHTHECQNWWKEIISWYDAQLAELNTEQLNNFSKAQLPFFRDLKESLDKNNVPFSACRDLLQMYACLKLCTPLNEISSALKTGLSNPESLWHNVKIFQKSENINYALSVPLNLNVAIESILRLNVFQVDSLAELINHLRPKSAYDKKLIPTDLINKKLYIQAQECFEHPHKVIRSLGYELLLLHSFSHPEKGALTNLIKYLPFVIEDQLIMVNLIMVLDFFPDEEETHKVTSSLKKYCQSFNGISNNGCYEFCLALAETNQSSAVVGLSFNLKLTVNEQIKLLKALLFKEPQEAVNVFSMLQSNNQIKGNEEIELFVKIAEAIQKNSCEPSHASQVLCLIECIKKLFRNQHMESLLKPICDPILKIVSSLTQYGFISKAAELLVTCTDHQLILVNANQETEAWLIVCEAGLKLPKTDIEILHGQWTRCCILKFDDQELALRKMSLASTFKQRLYDKYRDALIDLQNGIQGFCQKDTESIKHQIEKYNNNIVKLLESPELLDYAVKFLEQMSSADSSSRQIYTEIAVNITLECAKETFKDYNKLERLEAAVSPYLDTLKDTRKEYRVRQASLKIAQTLLLQKLPAIAMRWMQRIFKIAMPANSLLDPEAELIVSQKKHLALVSLNLPLIPPMVLEILTRMPKKELDIFSEIINQLPFSSSGEITNNFDAKERSILIAQAKECLKHSHFFIQRVGFELSLLCACTINASKVAVIDPPLLIDLISYLPVILATSGTTVNEKIIDRLKTLLQVSQYAEYTDAYLAEISVSKKNLNSTSFNEDVKYVFITLIKALIVNGEIEKAKEHLYNCVKKEILLKGDSDLTHLWLLLIEKVVQEKILSHNSIAKLLLSLLRDGTIGKKLLDTIQVDLIISLVEQLFGSKNDVSNEFAVKLFIQLNDSNLNGIQKEMSLQLIEKHIKSRLFKEGLIVGYQEITTKCSTLLTEESKLSLSKSFLNASIDHENLDLALEILKNLQFQLDVDSLQYAFEILINKLLNACKENSVDHKKIMQCYELLNCIELKSTQSVKFKYALQWMSIVKAHFGTVYSEERSVVLKMILQMMISELHTEDDILEIIDHLVIFLKANDGKKNSVFSDLKLLIASCHSKVAEKLRSAVYLEKFCEYLNALQQSHIFGSHSLDVLLEALWIASQYLEADTCTSSNLLEVHKLLNRFYGSPALLKNEGNIIKDLATTLIAHELRNEALKWIELIKVAFSDSTLDSFFVGWCHSLLTQKKPQLCLSVLKGLTIHPFSLAALFLQVSKALPDVDLSLSIQIISDNWDLLHANCPQDEFSEYVEGSIRTLFNSSQNIDVLTLFSTLMSLYQSQEEKFLIEQLHNCCTLINVTQNEIIGHDYIDRVLKTISTIFFEPTTAFPTKLSSKWIRYHMIRILLEQQNRELFSFGIQKINVHLGQLFPTSQTDQTWVWTVQSQKAIENWLKIFKDCAVSSSESDDIDQLFAHYSFLINLSPPFHKPKNEKNFTLLLLQISLHHSISGESVALEHFLLALKKYFDDVEWMEAATSLAINALIKMSVSSNDYLNFVNFFKTLTDQFREIDHEAYIYFQLQFIEKCLDSDLKEGILRSMLFYQLGISFDYLLKHYQSKTDKIFLDDGSINSMYKKEISKIVLLIERFLFIQPVLNFQYVITISPHEDLVRETTFSWNENQPPHVFEKSLSKGKDKSLFNSEKFVPQYANGLFYHRTYPLLKSVFIQRKVDLVNLLTEMGCYKAFFKEFSIFCLIVTEIFPQLIDDGSKELSHESAILAKTKRAEKEYAIISETINRLSAQPNYHSLAKALGIMQNIDPSLWQLYFVELKELSLKVLSHKQLYPYLIPEVCDALDLLNQKNKEHPEWMSLSTTLCFHVHNTLINFLKINKSMKLSEKNLEFARSAFSFFNKILKDSLIEKDPPDFIKHFKAQMCRIQFLNPTNDERGAITHFLKASLVNHPKYTTEMFKIIHQYFSQLMVLKPEFFEHNVELSLVLCTQKFYESNPQKYESIMPKLIQHFNICLNENGPEVFHYYLDCLVPLFSQISYSKGVEVARKLTSDLRNIIRKQIAKIIPKITSVLMLVQYIEVLLVLIKFKVFEGSKENIAQLSKLKECVVNLFQACLISNLVTDELCIAIRKLFNQKELASHDAFSDLGGKK